jgi:carbamate kinase
MLIVVALGGNALLRRDDPVEADVQRRNLAMAAHALSKLARDNEIVITHGNAPQVGLLALQSEAYRKVAPYPLDVLGAESEGMIGYVLEQELANAIPGRDVATLLTQVVVDPRDPAFGDPTKRVGPRYDTIEARGLAAVRGWTIAPDGDGWRRVVASPAPLDIVEVRAIEALVEAGVVVICAGGGGIPVTIDEHGMLNGVEAAVPKDRAAALLAARLGADALLLLTDVDGVYADFGRPGARRLATVTERDVERIGLPPGGMEAKVEAALWFSATTGQQVAIGSLDDAMGVLRGEHGTRVVALDRAAVVQYAS